MLPLVDIATITVNIYNKFSVVLTPKKKSLFKYNNLHTHLYSNYYDDNAPRAMRY